MRLNATHPAVARNAQALSGGPQDGSERLAMNHMTAVYKFMVSPHPA